jgi:hypothetical protein
VGAQHGCLRPWTGVERLGVDHENVSSELVGAHDVGGDLVKRMLDQRDRLVTDSTTPFLMPS